ncbi:MAG: phage terminase small subunit P27 family [Mesorhizobium sp.]|nr:MAG: phage terminase small subunit P27 family [Mesorhizobium sp.]TJV70329.1 MAG: phage terminase small subunit P27 family [Mesorhizobium sp.]
MGRRGPKPEPASVKLAKGKSGRRPIGVEPSAEEQAKTVATSGAVEPPAWLKGDALDVWNRLAPRVIGMKLLFPIDAETFGRYCRNFARWLKMQQRLDEMGEIYEIETASGKVRRADPSFIIGYHLERQLVTAEANFGLNPAERQRLFAARAAGSTGDLFSGMGSAPAAPGPDKTLASPAPAKPAAKGSAVGFLQ